MKRNIIAVLTIICAVLGVGAIEGDALLLGALFGFLTGLGTIYMGVTYYEL